MKTLTILGCKILQDEIVYLLENDPLVDEILVVSNGEEEYFSEKLKKIGIEYRVCSLEEIPAVIEADPPVGYRVVVYMTELGLHLHPQLLKSKVYQKIEELSEYSSGILLFFGLCGNAFNKIEEDFKYLEKSSPVRILKDDEGIIDDCIGATVGGNCKYRDILQGLTDKGTFLFTPMYAHAWREFERVSPENSDRWIELLRRMHEITGYKRVARIRTGLSYTDDFDEKIEEFAGLFDFEILEMTGGQKIFERCYASMKDRLALNNLISNN